MESTPIGERETATSNLAQIESKIYPDLLFEFQYMKKKKS